MQILRHLRAQSYPLGVRDDNPYAAPKTELEGPVAMDRYGLIKGIGGCFLNLFCMGSPGYLLLGQWKKALAVYGIVWVLSCLGLGILVQLAAMVDSVILGWRLSQGEEIGEWGMFGVPLGPPRESPGRRGWLITGVVFVFPWALILVVVGGLKLLQ